MQICLQMAPLPRPEGAALTVLILLSLVSSTGFSDDSITGER